MDRTPGETDQTYAFYPCACIYVSWRIVAAVVLVCYYNSPGFMWRDRQAINLGSISAKQSCSALHTCTHAHIHTHVPVLPRISCRRRLYMYIYIWFMYVYTRANHEILISSIFIGVKHPLERILTMISRIRSRWGFYLGKPYSSFMNFLWIIHSPSLFLRFILCFPCSTRQHYGPWKSKRKWTLVISTPFSSPHRPRSNGWWVSFISDHSSFPHEIIIIL